MNIRIIFKTGTVCNVVLLLVLDNLYDNRTCACAHNGMDTRNIWIERICKIYKTNVADRVSQVKMRILMQAPAKANLLFQ